MPTVSRYVSASRACGESGATIGIDVPGMYRPIFTGVVSDTALTTAALSPQNANSVDAFADAAYPTTLRPSVCSRTRMSCSRLGADPRRVVGIVVGGCDPDRAALHRLLPDVDRDEPVRDQQRVQGRHGEERPVLVVDEVERVADEQVRQVLHFEDRDTVRPECGLDAAQEVAEVVDVGEHVVADDHPEAAVTGTAGDVAGEPLRPRLVEHGQAVPLVRLARRSGGGLDTDGAHAVVGEVPQHGAVVGGDLQHAVADLRGEGGDHLPGVGLHVFDDGPGRTRVVRVVAFVQHGAVDDVDELHEGAQAARGEPQRVPDGVVVGPLREGARDRGGAEIEDAFQVRAATGPAGPALGVYGGGHMSSRASV